ncbi:hypothetical protein [Bartonella sp. HY761]|uniref:hypothetical protein n=1 Tax=Bartonella sp. HY761 TaxID=2979330 RepID=UPI0021FB783F|nr:hypothetical protein [Bartonella sp. HY761]UXN05558.1 hypothetical protein N6A79_09640 [Bartonella sp. HY761]
MTFIRNDLFELLNPDFSELLHEKYLYCVVEYVQLHLKGDYEGKVSHKLAALHAMEEILLRIERYFEKVRLSSCNKNDDFNFTRKIEVDKLSGVPYSVDRFFLRPSWVWDGIFDEKGNCISGRLNNCEYEQYAYAFALTPYFMAEKNLDDWEAVNYELFPNRKELEIYSWNDDWQEFYFSNGKEWWGCFYWTVYDPLTKVFTIVAASTTD